MDHSSAPPSTPICVTMSVDALKQVFGDPSPLSPGVQAICLAVAWRTPQGRDATGPLSYRTLGELTHYSTSSVRRHVLEAISTGALEVVWARLGEPARYRINRGEWHIPTDPAVLEAALEQLATDRGEQGQMEDETPGQDGLGTQVKMKGEVGQDGLGTQVKMKGDPGQNDLPLRKEKKRSKGDDGPPPTPVDLVEPDPSFVARFAHLVDDPGSPR